MSTVSVGNTNEWTEDIGKEDGEKMERMNKKMLNRQKVFYSVCLCLSYLTCGWNLALIGSALLDLQRITSVSLEEASFYQTFFNVGYFIGSLLCGIIYKRINKFIFQFLALVLVAVSLSVIPWCFLHVVMVIAHFFVGLSGGIVDSVVNAEMLSVWGNKGLAFMHAMHFSYAFGGIISPIITAQFLSPRQQHQNDVIFQDNSTTTHYVTYNVTPLSGNLKQFSVNTTVFFAANNSVKVVNGSTESFAEIPFYLNSRLYISYTISATICLLIGLPYLVMYFTFDLTRIRSGRPSVDQRSAPTLTRLKKIFVLINMGAMAGIYVAIEESFSGFLNAFCVNRLDWLSSDGSYATSIFYGCFGFGRLIAVLWVKCINPKKILSVFCVSLTLMFVSMLLCGTYYFKTGVWITSALTGMSIAVIYPTIFTWTEEDFLPVSGKISSYFNITSALGGTINPLLIGTMMDIYSPMWYTYLLLGESLLLLLTYILGLILSKQFGNTGTSTEEVIENVEQKHFIDQE